MVGRVVGHPVSSERGCHHLLLPLQLALAERRCCQMCPCTCVGLPGPQGPRGTPGGKVRGWGSRGMREGCMHSPRCLSQGQEEPWELGSAQTLHPPAGKGARLHWFPAQGSSPDWGGHDCCSQGLSVLGGDRQQGTCWRGGRARA